jgi:hypothetical protein
LTTSIGDLQRPNEQREASSILRFDWTNLERLSPLTLRMEAHQRDCSKPFVKFQFNPNGLGSNLHVHSLNFCNVLEENKYRFRTIFPWTWLDVGTCAAIEGVDLETFTKGNTYPGEETHTPKTNRMLAKSALSCYFTGVDYSCPQDKLLTQQEVDELKLYYGTFNPTEWYKCDNLTNAAGGVHNVRASNTELFFTRVSPTVQAEAERQYQLVYGTKDNPENATNDKGGVTPPNLITVHMRWGDKKAEMELVAVEEYIRGVQQAIEMRQNQVRDGVITDPKYWDATFTDVNIFLATEDPRAYAAFAKAAPSNWTIYSDHYFTEFNASRRDEYDGQVNMAREMGGHPGLVALGSLLVAMEANTFILTTESNWSRVMNELRRYILNPRCGECTVLVDLSPGEQ